MTVHAVVICQLLLVILTNGASAQTFKKFVTTVNSESDSTARSRIVFEFLAGRSIPVVEDSLVHFVFRGKAGAVAVPGELNGWDPRRSAMTRLPGTDLFVRTDTLPVDARVEYKLWVDSAWILDPLNSKKARGGYGDNSDVWMPKYVPQIPDEAAIPAGTFDTLWIASNYLQVRHAVIVYTPLIRQDQSQPALPLLLVTDGVDYLTFGRMPVIIDVLLRSNSIRPLIAAFIEPRTELNVDSTNKRMNEYAASDAFVDFLEKEVVPRIGQSYPVSDRSDERVILGASMGGLIATYAVLTRPGFIANCAAQSPAYRQADSAVIKLAESIERTPANIFLQTGTIRDTQDEARQVYHLLKVRGAQIRYEEIHEGHNWTNWRGHLGKMLGYFFPPN